MNFSYVVGWCYYCNQGNAYIVKEISTHRMLIWCDECDTIWESPDDFRGNTPMLDTENLTRIEDVTFEDVVEKGWETFIDR